MVLRPRGGQTRALRLESLEDRSLLTVTPITPAAAVQQMNVQSAIAATLATQTQNTVLATEAGLLNVAKQLDSDNLRQLTIDTMAGNSAHSVLDLQERNSIVAAEQRITTEYSQLNTNLLAANQTFRNQSAALVLGVNRGTIVPATAVATQVTDYEAFKSAAVTVQLQAAADNQFELINLQGLVQLSESIANQKTLGNFTGKFDIKGTGPTPGVLTDYQGVVTTHVTVTANLLQGTFTAATTDYLQAYATVGTTTQLVKQPITGGTITAAISPTSDPSGFNIHGSVHMLLGPIDNLQPSASDFQIAARLTGTNILSGNLIVNNQVVGTFSWMVH